MIFFIPFANANSVKIDPKYFSLADNLEEFNAFPEGVLSWETTYAAIRNAVENKLCSKRRPLNKADKVHYSITGFSHALLVWAFESILTIASKFMTKHVEANPRMLSWTSADNVKFDAVMLASTAGNPTTAYHVSDKHKRKVQNDDLDAMKIDFDDLRLDPQDDGFLDSNISDIAEKGVKATMDFLSDNKEDKDEEKEDKEEDEEEEEEEEENEDDDGENDEEDEDEEEDEEKEDEEDEDEKGENDEAILKIFVLEKDKEYEEEGDEGEAKENKEKKYENGEEKEEEKKDEATKEKEEEKKDEAAKGEEEERNDEEAAMEQDREE
ncbi:hypothetical protein TIFTF001_017573 [Ficus carica]|uniref:Uncharacterized protein n=1 Tax=Ficus carica TaxID=3494 RepID=A0AA88AUJ3_FICCA|nr:hypothetical protein TIFTF001_017573 [Ficus carica]